MIPGSMNWKENGKQKQLLKRTASVFPEPVLAMETMSRPLIAIGQEIDWMTVGFWNFP